PGRNNHVDPVNPYSPPAAAVGDRDAAVADDTLIPNGRRRPLHHGVKWIAQGWDLFKRQPGMWILSVVLFYGALMVASLIPFVSLFTSILWPVFAAGFFVMAHMSYRRERFNLSDLFSGFRKAPGTLALIGGSYVLALILIIAVF